MKKKLINLVVSLIFLSMSFATLAQVTPPGPGPDTREVCCGENSILVQILNYMIWILIIVAAIFIVIAAYYFVIAAGNPETISKARNFVLYALVGVLVAALARGLVWFVVTQIGGYRSFY